MPYGTRLIQLTIKNIRQVGPHENPPSIPPRQKDNMTETSQSIKEVLAEFLTTIIPKISRELTRESLIDIHQLISGSAASMASNIRGGRNGPLTLTMNTEEYMAQTGHTFIRPHNPGNYPPTMGTSKEQALRTERFRQNQALFRRSTTVYVTIKKQTVTSVCPVFLSPLMDHLMGFGKVTEVQMIQYIFSSYQAIYEIDLEKPQSI